MAAAGLQAGQQKGRSELLNQEVNLRQVLKLVGWMLGVGALVVLLSWQLRSYRALTRTVQQEQVQVEQLAARMQALEQLRMQGPEMQAELLRQSRLIPPTADEGGIAPYLQSLTPTPGDRVYEIRFGAHTNQKTYNAIPLEIAYDGSFAGLLQLLGQMGEGRRFVRLDSVRVLPLSTRLPGVKAEISATTFYRTAK